MSELEIREINCISNCNNYDDTEINWAFFSLFSNIIEKLNGGVYCAR